MLDPPKDVPAEVLFRRLCELPRPSVDIAYRIAGAEHVELRVQAITAAEMAGSAAEIVAASLLSGRTRAFNSAAEVTRSLSVGELGRLLRAVEEGLSRCSPVDGWSNWKAWDTRLLEGARHYTNRRAAYSLGSQFSVSDRFLLDRPENYFGVSAAALIDAHWFAYRAARAYFFECQKVT